MKGKNLFITLGLALGLGFGVAAGLSAGKDVKEVKADGTYSGTVYLQLNTADWKSSSSSVGVYFFDEAETPNHAWGPRLNPNGTSTYYEYNYSGFSFQPTKCIVSRFYKDDQALADWMIDWNNGGVYARTTDVTLDDVIWLGEYYPDSKSVHFGTYTLETVVTDGSAFEVELDHYTISDDHLEAFGSVTFTEETDFYLYPKCDGAAPGAYVTKYGTPDALASSFSGGNGSAITCSKAGTYDFFFKFTDTKEVWITNDVIVEADAWGIYFNSHVGCDTNGVNKPSGWKLVSDEYATLSNDAKDYIYDYEADEDGDNLARALATYDWAIHHNPNLSESDRFIVDSHSQVRTSGYIGERSFNMNSSFDSTIIIVVAISAIAVASFILFVSLKKKKHN